MEDQRGRHVVAPKTLLVRDVPVAIGALGVAMVGTVSTRK